jgi:hypothetical protein
VSPDSAKPNNFELCHPAGSIASNPKTKQEINNAIERRGKDTWKTSSRCHCIHGNSQKKILPLRDTIKKKTLQRIKYTKKNPKFPWFSEAAELIGGIISL